MIPGSRSKGKEESDRKREKTTDMRVHNRVGCPYGKLDALS